MFSTIFFHKHVRFRINVVQLKNNKICALLSMYSDKANRLYSLLIILYIGSHLEQKKFVNIYVLCIELYLCTYIGQMEVISFQNWVCFMVQINGPLYIEIDMYYKEMAYESVPLTNTTGFCSQTEIKNICTDKQKQI